MKASSHIKDFRELFCEENSAHFVHSVIASFGHLQSRGKTWSSQRYFFIYKLLEALKESVLILSIWSVPSSEVKMQYELIYFSGITLSTQAPSLSCSCWCFLCPQICVPALLHIPSALPLLNSWEITNSPSDFLPILRCRTFGVCGRWRMHPRSKEEIGCHLQVPCKPLFIFQHLWMFNYQCARDQVWSPISRAFVWECVHQSELKVLLWLWMLMNSK